MPTQRNGYDAFISHNRADKPRARALAERIARVELNGRPLRPWLDEQFLDPGVPGRDVELTTALDRSRTLVLLVSPASAKSKWVRLEVEHFLEAAEITDVIPAIVAPCELPPELAGAEAIDLTGVTTFDEIVERLRPQGGPGVEEARTAVEAAWSTAVEADPGGLDAEPSPAREAVLDALMAFDIADPLAEGLAITGFMHAVALLHAGQESAHPSAYNMKMLLGECLAVAMHRHPRYRQVAQRILDVPRPADGEPVPAFVVARAASKLAEINPALVDLGLLLRIAADLDGRPGFDNRDHAVAMLLGRVASKLRGTAHGDLLIRTLAEGGLAGRLAAIGAISVASTHSPSVFYLGELERLAGTRTEGGESEPPSRRLQGLLFGIDLDQPAAVAQALDIAKWDLERAFGIDDLPYGVFWPGLRDEPPAEVAHRAPFMGSVLKATTADWEEVALRVEPSHVVCLTEPRIVDALFEGAGALLIPQQDDPTQRRRLEGRAMPFAVLDSERMGALCEDDIVTVSAGGMRIMSA